MERTGYNGVLFPVSTLRIALKQVARFLKSLHESGSQRDFLPEMLTRQELYDLLDYQGYEARDRIIFKGLGSHMSADKGSAGLAGIVAGQTAVSSLANGLSYRGYAVEELAEQASYEQVAYLLLHGEAPTPAELEAFRDRIAATTELPDELWRCLYQLPRDAKPMDVLRSAVSLLSHWSPTAQDNSDSAELIKAEQLLGQVAVVLAGWYRISHGMSPIEYRRELSLAENLLRMIRNDEPTKLEIRALDVSLILYAEHEFNASTFTARVVASTLADYHSAITAAIAALKVRCMVVRMSGCWKFCMTFLILSKPKAGYCRHLLKSDW